MWFICVRTTNTLKWMEEQQTVQVQRYYTEYIFIAKRIGSCQLPFGIQLSGMNVALRHTLLEQFSRMNFT